MTDGFACATDKSALIRIVDSPSGSPIVSLFGHLMLHVESPRSQTSVTVSVNSVPLLFPQQCVSVPGGRAAHRVALSNPHERHFDVSNEPRHIVRLGGDEYEIRLLQIGQVEEEGHVWPWYEFQVTKRPA